MKKYSACEDIYHAVECVDNSEKRSDIFNLISIDGDVEFYITSEADEEIRATRHALWIARAERAKAVYENYESYFDYLNMLELIKDDSWDGSNVDALHWLNSWQLVERKCREKAEEFK